MVTAYEADLQVLEEARNAYVAASELLLERLRIAISNLEPTHAVAARLEKASYATEALVDDAPYLRVSWPGSVELPSVELLAWVASAWGGSDHALRVGLVLANLPHPFSADEPRWVRLGRDRADDLPGEPYAADRHLDAGDRRWLRLHTIDLAERERGELLAEVIEAGSIYVAAAERVLASIEEAARPLLEVYRVLREEVPRVAAWSGEMGVVGRPSRADKLPTWRGYDFVQISEFWIGIDAASSRVVAMAYDQEQGAIGRIAERLGRSIERIEDLPSVVLLDAEEIESGSHTERIGKAFELWLEWRREAGPAAIGPAPAPAT